jgi:hypothetical protein
MKIKNTLKKIVTGASIVLASYMPMKAIAQSDVVEDQIINTTEQVDKNLEGKIGFATLETSLTDDLQPRIRGIVNSNASYKKIELGYRSLHETQGNWYFSRNVPTLGKKYANTKLCAVIKADQNGIFDKKYGIRNTSIPSKIGDYGWTTLTANKEGTELAFFVGKDLGKGYSGEIFNATNVGFDKNISNYNEIQINKQITKHINAFGRFELSISDKTPNTVYLIGVSLTK